MSQPESSPGADRAVLLSRLQIELSDDLIDQALTHRSYSYEHGGVGNNERLEFLGDSILGQAVTVMLFTENPDLDEGDLAKRRASLVSTVALAEVARIIGLGPHLRLHRRPSFGLLPLPPNLVDLIQDLLATAGHQLSRDAVSPRFGLLMAFHEHLAGIEGHLALTVYRRDARRQVQDRVFPEPGLME